MALDRWVVERFHRVLVEEIRRERPEYLEAPFTVAEIYQSLVPYRTHRDRIGVELNGDYEEALLSLLAGDAGYLELDSEPARERIRRELASRNPNTGVYREFAAVTVRLNRDRLAAVPETESSGPVSMASGPGEEAPSGSGAGQPVVREKKVASEAAATPSANPGAERDTASGSAAPSVAGVAGSVSPSSSPRSSSPSPPPAPAARPPASASPPFPRASSAPSSSSARDGVGPAQVGSGGGESDGGEPGAESPRPADCPECASALPDRANLRFCPFCGVDVFTTSCSACDEELDRRWAFCIACGTPAASASTVAGPMG